MYILTYICVTGGVCDGKSYAGRFYIKYKCSWARSELKCLLYALQTDVSGVKALDMMLMMIYIYIRRLEAMENRIASLMWCLIPAQNFAKVSVVTGWERHINLVKILAII